MNHINDSIHWTHDLKGNPLGGNVEYHSDNHQAYLAEERKELERALSVRKDIVLRAILRFLKTKNTRRAKELIKEIEKVL